MTDRREGVPDREEMLRAAMDDRAAQVFTSLPGIVESYDPAAMTVSVQIALQIQVTKQDGSKEMQAISVLPDVPVCFPGAGGYTLTFPIKPGDECLVMFAMKCIDSWWQMGGVQAPLDARMHDPSDGFALFSPRSQPRVLNPPPSGQNATLRADDGSAAIELAPGGKVIIRAPGGLEIVAPMVQSSGDVVANGVSSVNHVHMNTQAGNGVSGVPRK